MIKKLLLLLLTVAMLAKHPGPGGDKPGNGEETPEQRRQREEDEMWGSRGGSSTTLEEQFDSVSRELGTAEGGVNTSPTTSSGPQGAWKTDDKEISDWHAQTTNLGGLSWERRQKILDGNPDDLKDGGHRYGTDRPGKTEFPERWDDDTVANNVQDAARNPDSVRERAFPKRGYEAFKKIDGVDVFVVLNMDGSVYSAYPTGGQGVKKNPN